VSHLSLTAAGEAGILPMNTGYDTREFDREWALTIIASSLQKLEAENESKACRFKLLRPWLDGDAVTLQAIVAEKLGISETAVKVAIHRLRVRFRELIRVEVGATVSHPSEISDELQYLI